VAGRVGGGKPKKELGKMKRKRVTRIGNYCTEEFGSTIFSGGKGAPDEGKGKQLQKKGKMFLHRGSLKEETFVAKDLNSEGVCWGLSSEKRKMAKLNGGEKKQSFQLHPDMEGVRNRGRVSKVNVGLGKSPIKGRGNP